MATKPIQIGDVGIGTLAGGTAGALLGSQVGKGKTAHIVGGIAGGLLGGVLGGATEAALTAKPGTQYAIKTANGSIVTVDQEGPQAFQLNQRVLIIYDSSTPHLMADNSK